MERRNRRSFTAEFMGEAIRLAREGTKSLSQVVKDLELTESALRMGEAGRRQGTSECAQPSRARGAGPPTKGEPTVDGARRLKKAAAFFTKED